MRTVVPASTVMLQPAPVGGDRDLGLAGVGALDGLDGVALGVAGQPAETLQSGNWRPSPALPSPRRSG
jgi:hypothetical protein